MHTPSLRSFLPSVLLVSFVVFLAARTHGAEPVTLTERDEVIPTYLSGPPDPNPMFYFGRQSQGAEGRIYPYPLYDNLLQRRGEQSYHLIYLENEFVKIGVSPQLGGRLFSAVDKTNNYDFVYRQHAIKPSLIGLTGSWISGGIEWNIPHHHRASTFLPVQHRIEENADGSKTVWVGELEIRHRMRWAVGYTLRPGSSVLECSLRITNRTPVINTMLCFANVAVNTNENYQIIFPPSTQWAVHHAKREFSAWPISKSVYGGADFTKGVDVSWYKNHTNANSMFAWNYSDDFFAGYDHGKQAGTMSIADHHIVPGKKFWTWGNGPRGRMWDEILTDTDGPYIELMVGAYSDNQPDYSWLQPFEARSFEMYWYPFRDIDGVKNANLDAAVNLEVKDGMAKFGFYATKVIPAATARLTAAGKVLLEETIAINPAKPYARQIAVPAGTDAHDVRASLVVGGRELIAYSPIKLNPMPALPVVNPPPAPADFKTGEELFLAGQRIDQFHDAIREADPYWAEALRRDPGDSAAHTGMGLLSLRRAEFASAEQHFRAALERLAAKYTTVKNAEPLYYLGVALTAQGKNDAAFEAFYKAAWSQEWKAPAYFFLAEISSTRGDFAAALGFANQSLDANALNVRAYGLKVAMLRHLNRAAEAREVLAFAMGKTDPLDMHLLAEQWLGTDRKTASRAFENGAGFINTMLETAIDYANAGLNEDARHVLEYALARSPDANQPLANYWLGHLAEKSGDLPKAAEYRRRAAAAAPDYVFPFQAETITALRSALAANPSDARAAYYLGNLLFDWQPAEAVACWEKSAAIDAKFPIVWRNLAQAYWHRDSDASRLKAVESLEKAIAAGGIYPTHFAELDQFYEAVGIPVEKRLALLVANREVVTQKDESFARLIALKTASGKPEEAIEMLRGRTFGVWEGGSGFNTGEAWANAHLARGLRRMEAKQFKEALADFETAENPPANLRAAEARVGSQQAELTFWIGCAREALGQKDEARRAWNEVLAFAAPTPRRGAGSLFLPLNLQRFHQARAAEKLGQTTSARDIYQELVRGAKEALTQAVDPADAEQPLPTRPSLRLRSARAHYVAGLGYSGLGEKDLARKELEAVLAILPDHLGAKLALGQL